MKKTFIFSFILIVLISMTSQAQFTQQGSKLIGSGPEGNSHQGKSVSISADGNTAIVGGSDDSIGRGAVWIYTRSGGVWTQQGNKLIGSGAVGTSYQGWSVSISADGNTAIVGGFGDNGQKGATWVFTRSAGIWTQQGSKLVGTVAKVDSKQGMSVALSADGNTAFIGGSDTVGIGAWVFTRSAGIWTQQGSKLVGSGPIVAGSTSGVDVSISGDGNTAIIGDPNYNNGLGTVWVYSRSGGVWSQQGNELSGFGDRHFGGSVTLSADGNTAIVGEPSNNNEGAAWAFTRSGGVWTQQGSKLVGTGGVGDSHQGSSVSLSSDGNTLIVGGMADDWFTGAIWVYTRSVGVWTQEGEIN